jgi:uncharacterized protein
MPDPVMPDPVMPDPVMPEPVMPEPVMPEPVAGRPLPSLDEPDTAEFWAATAAGRLTYRVCRTCGTPVFYPRSHCPADLTRELDTRDSAGRGTLYAFTVLRRSAAPAHQGRLPVVLGLVELAEGFRMLTEITGAEPGEVRIGMALRLCWEPHERVQIPLFEPDQLEPDQLEPGDGADYQAGETRVS